MATVGYGPYQRCDIHSGQKYLCGKYNCAVSPNLTSLKSCIQKYLARAKATLAQMSRTDTIRYQDKEREVKGIEKDLVILNMTDPKGENLRCPNQKKNGTSIVNSDSDFSIRRTNSPLPRSTPVISSVISSVKRAVLEDVWEKSLEAGRCLRVTKTNTKCNLPTKGGNPCHKHSL